jgi:hypothetical protein
MSGMLFLTPDEVYERYRGQISPRDAAEVARSSHQPGRPPPKTRSRLNAALMRAK